MRQINYIIIHCSATKAGRGFKARLPLHEAASNQGERADEERRWNESPMDC